MTSISGLTEKVGTTGTDSLKLRLLALASLALVGILRFELVWFNDNIYRYAPWIEAITPEHIDNAVNWFAGFFFVSVGTAIAIGKLQVIQEPSKFIGRDLFSFLSHWLTAIVISCICVVMFAIIVFNPAVHLDYTEPGEKPTIIHNGDALHFDDSTVFMPIDPAELSSHDIEIAGRHDLYRITLDPLDFSRRRLLLSKHARIDLQDVFLRRDFTTQLDTNARDIVSFRFAYESPMSLSEQCADSESGLEGHFSGSECDRFFRELFEDIGESSGRMLEDTMKWTPIFGPAAKVVFEPAPNRRGRSRYHEEDPYEAQPGVQGEGGVGGTARPGVGGRDCAPLQGPRQRSLQVETAAARQRGAVVRDGPWRWRGVGAGGCPTQEDRRADGGAGFFIQRARALPMTQRRVLMAPNGTLSMRRQCALLAVTRSSVYYEPVVPDAEELALMRRIDELHLQHPFFGSRMITQTLKAEGPVINRKRVQRLMRLMGLESTAPQPTTSTPAPNHPVYPYLLRGLTIARPNQVWATDITYIPMARGFAYLVAIIDWYSRRVLAWRLSNTLDTGFCIEALRDALAHFGRPTIFNTDQGSQFTAGDFTRVLRDRGIKISMDGKGRYLDNIFVERLWRSLKYEEIYLHPYDSLTEAREGIGRYFRFYNDARPHAKLGYQTPAAFYDSMPRPEAA